MNEFSLIDVFFKKIARSREEVVYGIGDDAACINVPPTHHMLVSTDTLIEDVHFLSNWDAYDIAYKAVMVNVSDIAAMAGKPCWLSLALTLPALDKAWLQRFSQGFHNALKQFDMALIGGDTTHGPLSVTITIQGLVPVGKSVRRVGAQVGDRVYVSGELGAAAFAVESLQKSKCPRAIDKHDKQILMQKLQHPSPRVDLASILQTCASAAIDISDGLSADLHHLCVASEKGACLSLAAIPTHSLVQKYQQDKAVYFALHGGDDYELCFTVSLEKEQELLSLLAQKNLTCYPIGWIEENSGLRVIDENGEEKPLTPRGYDHFKEEA